MQLTSVSGSGELKISFFFYLGCADTELFKTAGSQFFTSTSRREITIGEKGYWTQALMLGQQLLKSLDYGSLDYLNIYSLVAALSVQHWNTVPKVPSSYPPSRNILNFMKSNQIFFLCCLATTFRVQDFFIDLLLMYLLSSKIGLRGIIWMTVSGRANFTPV